MKVAIFVEGMTELEFLKVLIREMYGSKQFHLQVKQQFAGQLHLVLDAPVVGVCDFVLIVNCQTDSQVKSQIVDQYPSLVAAGYSAVIGLRDVFPLQQGDLNKVTGALYAGLPVGGVIPIFMHLSVLETEAWFLDELTHFEKIDTALTVESIVANGFDVVNTLGEMWPHPTETLKKIYRLANKTYNKKNKTVRRTVAALNPEEMYLTVRARSPHFAAFLVSLEAALFPAA